MNSERNLQLERAQSLVNQFWETYEELWPWLTETEMIISQLPAPALEYETLKQQQEEHRVSILPVLKKKVLNIRKYFAYDCGVLCKILKTERGTLLLKKKIKTIIQSIHVFSHVSAVYQTVHVSKSLWGRQQVMCKHKRGLKGNNCHCTGRTEDIKVIS